MQYFKFLIYLLFSKVIFLSKYFSKFRKINLLYTNHYDFGDYLFFCVEVRDKLNSNTKIFCISKLQSEIASFFFEKDNIVNSFFQDGFKILNNSGNMIFASHPKKGKKIKIDSFDLIKGNFFFGSWDGGIDYEKNSKKIFKILKGIKNFDKLFNEKLYNLNNINSAIQDLKDEKVLRPIVKLY